MVSPVRSRAEDRLAGGIADRLAAGFAGRLTRARERMLGQVRQRASAPSWTVLTRLVRLTQPTRFRRARAGGRPLRTPAMIHPGKPVRPWHRAGTMWQGVAEGRPRPAPDRPPAPARRTWDLPLWPSTRRPGERMSGDLRPDGRTPDGGPRAQPGPVAGFPPPPAIVRRWPLLPPEEPSQLTDLVSEWASHTSSRDRVRRPVARGSAAHELAVRSLLPATPAVAGRRARRCPGGPRSAGWPVPALARPSRASGRQGRRPSESSRLSARPSRRRSATASGQRAVPTRAMCAFTPMTRPRDPRARCGPPRSRWAVMFSSRPGASIPARTRVSGCWCMR